MHLLPSKKFLFWLHGWMGLNLGLLLFIVCFSGTVATLSHEIDWLFNPAVRADAVEDATALSWDRWRDAVHREHPDARLISLGAPPGRGWAAIATVTYAPGDTRHVYLDPATGGVQGTFSFFNVARFFRSFHKQLYIYPGKLPHGIYVVGPLAFLLLLSGITGLLFYRIRWNDLVMRVRRSSPRTFWSTLHRATGVWTVAFSIIFALTGIWYFAERAVVDAGIPLPSAEAMLFTKPESSPRERSTPLTLDECVAEANRVFPELDVKVMFFLSSGPTTVAMYGEGDAWLVRDAANHVIVDAASGAVVRRQDAAELSVPARLAASADPLHFGTFGGLGTKLLYFFAGSLISASILVGARIWYLRIRQGEPLRKRRTPIASLASLALTLPILALATYGSVVNVGDSIVHERSQVVSRAQLVSASVQPASDAPNQRTDRRTYSTTELVPLYVWVVVGSFVILTTVVAMGWLRWVR